MFGLFVVFVVGLYSGFVLFCSILYLFLYSIFHSIDLEHKIKAHHISQKNFFFLVYLRENDRAA